MRILPAISSSLVTILIASMALADGSGLRASVPDQPSAAGSRQNSSSAGSQSGSSYGSITGEVLADGAPATDATIILTPSKGSVTTNLAALTGLQKATIDETGKFKIEGLGDLAYTVSALLPGYVVESGLEGEGGRRLYYRPGDYAAIRMVKGGVITGRVLDAAGQPVVGAPVQATRVKDANARPAFDTSFEMSQLERQWKTDDRGIYRIYGLRAGAYVVSAGGKGLISFGPDAFSGETPSYHPSGTRDTAVEVKVGTGQEVSGIDITYRGDKGHIISGSLSGAIPEGPTGAALVALWSEKGGMLSLGFGFPVGSGHPFAMNGVADGEYRIFAFSATTDNAGVGAISAPLTVKVNGSDVTGLQLVLSPPASLAGVATLEPLTDAAIKKKCAKERAPVVTEAVIGATPSEAQNSGGLPEFDMFGIGQMFGSSISPEKNGSFRFPLFRAGRYRLDPTPPGANWYVRSVMMAGIPGKAPVDASAGINVASGAQVSGITLALTEGAAAVNGKIAAPEAGTPVPEHLKAILIPAEPEAAANTLRYAEVTIKADGTFSFANLAPGKYFILPQKMSDKEWNDPSTRPAWWRPEGHARLRKRAESSEPIELQPCQRVTDYSLSLAPKPQPKPPQ